jgi:hypothetical protein
MVFQYEIIGEYVNIELLNVDSYQGHKNYFLSFKISEFNFIQFSYKHNIFKLKIIFQNVDKFSLEDSIKYDEAELITTGIKNLIKELSFNSMLPSDGSSALTL